jgi:prepilin-type N-terminal cleavage/methylation domain-containing protein
VSVRAIPARRGFTLLEVTLALSVGVLLLAALYVAVDVQLKHARAGRAIVEQATLARSLLVRVEADAAAAATLIDPERFRSPSNSSGGSSGQTGSGSSATTATSASSGTAAGSAGSTGSSGSSTSGTSSSGGSVATDAVTLPLSVQGDSSTLHLFITRLPREAIPADPTVAPQVVSDLRRVSWWMAGGGLARQEVAVATSQDALQNLPPGVPDEDAHVLAPEVKSVQFQYFDGSSWQDSWDCTTAGADGVTPIGPPQAVAVTLEIAVPQEGAKADDAPTKRYRHVVGCLSANGTTPQQQGTTGGTGQ